MPAFYLFRPKTHLKEKINVWTALQNYHWTILHMCNGWILTFATTTLIISGWGRCWGSCRGCCLNLSNGTLQKWKICKNGKFEKMEKLQKWKISSKSNCFLPWLSVLVSFNIPLKLSFKLKMLKKNCYKYVDDEEEKPRWLEINCFVRLTYDTL